MCDNCPMKKERYIYQHIISDLTRKFVLLSGPRQVGKTTFARALPFTVTYLNYDEREHRRIIRAKEWPKDAGLLVLDELHKMKDWKRFLKGIYDVVGLRPPILVTGSARLDIAKRMGDSLAGRFLGWRLHPLCVKELSLQGEAPEVAFKKLLTVGGFPEPYYNGEVEYYRRWATSHLDIIIRQDLIQLERVTDLASIETLLELLSTQVGSAVSYESLAQELERDAGTIKRWLTILENLFIIFKVPPWNRNFRKAIKKKAKYYFYDIGRVQNGPGARFENLVACALRKELDYLHDANGLKGGLHYVRSRDGHELDFLVSLSSQPSMLVEAKLAEANFSPHFAWFSKYFSSNTVKSYQLVADLKTERESQYGTKLVSAPLWLAKLSLAGQTTSPYSMFPLPVP